MDIPVVFVCLVLFCYHHQISGTPADNCARKSFSGDCQHCNTGWFGDKCDKPCQGRCDVGGCDKHIGVCDQCGKGYYGLYCADVCPENCKNTICDRDSGHCYQCNYGWWGNHCDSQCPPNCADGQCSCREGTCASCKEGWWGQKCTEPCSDKCQENQCKSNDGFCEKGCKPGMTGPKCDKQCSFTCVDNDCSQLEGACLAGCKDGWYGSHCSMDCPQHCTHCNQKTGLCTHCEDGWYGTSCSSKCPVKCILKKCFMDGTCSIKVENNASQTENKGVLEISAVTAAVYATTVGAIILLVCALVYAGKFISKRIMKRSPGETPVTKKRADNSGTKAEKEYLNISSPNNPSDISPLPLGHETVGTSPDNQCAMRGGRKETSGVKNEAI